MTGACPFAAAAGAGSTCRRSRSACGRILAELTSFETGRAVLRRAFDLGVTHFDLANNYGPPYGSAEENFGRWMAADFRPYRDELIISTKAGYDMWPGPYGGRRIAQIPARQPRPEPQAHGARLCRYLLFASCRRGDSARGDDGCARSCLAAGQGALRRHFLLFARADPAGA